MTKKGVLIVNKMHDSILPKLEGIGVHADYHPNISRQEILEIIKDYKGIIVRSKLHLDEEFFEHATNLQFVARAGAGLDQIDTAAAFNNGVKIFNAPEGNRDALAEHAIALLLGLLTKVPKANQEVKEGKWLREDNRGFELMNKTVGILGLGYMGKAFANKLRGFGCEIIGYDIRNDIEIPDYINKVSWDQFRELSDIVSVHVSLNVESIHLVREPWINQFKKNIWLVNTSRGDVLKMSDLVKALDSGKVLGAALDVIENEKPDSFNSDEKQVFENIAKRNNTILTPHVGGWSEESYSRINDILVSKIKDFLLQNG